MDEHLTRRIRDLPPLHQRLLRLAAAGATTADLAVRLGLTPHHVRRHLRDLMVVLAVGSLDEAIVLWWGSRAGARAEVRVAALALVA